MKGLLGHLFIMKTVEVLKFLKLCYLLIITRAPVKNRQIMRVLLKTMWITIIQHMLLTTPQLSRGCQVKEQKMIKKRLWRTTKENYYRVLRGEQWKITNQWDIQWSQQAFRPKTYRDKEHWQKGRLIRVPLSGTSHLWLRSTRTSQLSVE